MRPGHVLRTWLLVVVLLGGFFLPVASIGMPVATVSADEGTPPPEADPQIVDTDGDTVPDDTDNCIDVANADQFDSDGDLIGDACDDEPFGPPTPTPTADPDGDGFSDSDDNCFWDYNPDQADADSDGVGDVCDPDYVPPIIDNDGDGVEDDQDNCPGVANPGQEQAYGYNIGVACYGDPTPYTIRSVSGDTWESVPGVCYQFNEVNTAAVINVCDGDGIDEASGDIVTITIPVGVYELTIIAPTGYTPESNPQQLFAMPQGSNSIEIVLNVESVAATGLIVQSLDLDGNPIGGGVYQLYSGQDCGSEPDLVSTVEAFEDGTAPFDNLQPGAYCVVAQYPPAGYNLPSDTTIEGIEVYAGSTQHWYVHFPNPSVPGNTQPGTNVTVGGLADGTVTVTFATVIQGGETSATVENPADAYLPPIYRATTALVYNLTTTSHFENENGITACVSFDPGQFAGASSVSFLYRWHGAWIDSGTSGNPALGELCGVTYHPGFIAIAELASTATLHVTLTDSGGTPITGKCFLLTDISVACDRDDGVADGQMTFSDQIPVGTYPLYWSIGAAASDYFYQGPVGQSVTIPEGTSEVFETVVLSAGVQVTVVDESSTPLEGACFALQGNDYGLVSCGTTPTFYSVPDGSYTLTNTRRPAGYERVDGSDGVYQIDVVAGTLSTFDAVFRQIVTPVGQNVVVQPDGAPGVQLTFSEITASGVTTAQSIAPEDAPALPNGFSVDGAVYFDISTTATYTGAIEVCLPYDPGAFSNPIDARLLHFDEGVGDWVDVTTSNDGTGTVCGSVTGLSPFAVAEPETIVTIHLSLIDDQGQPVTGKCLVFNDGANDHLGCDRFPDTPDGEMTIEGDIPAGTYELEWALGAAASDFFVRSAIGQSITIPADTTDVTATVILTPSFRVNVTDADGNPLPGACFSLTAAGYGQGSCMPIQNYYNVPDGTYTLTNFQTPYGYERADLSNGIYGITIQSGQLVIFDAGFRLLNTQAGTDVVVQPEGAPGVQLTFAEITTSGTTTVQTIAAGDAPALPTGFSVDGAVYFEISTTAEFTGAITLCLPYNPADFTNPADAKLFHGENGVWVDVTTSNDGAGTICGSITSFSPFAIAEPAVTTPQLIISGFGPPVSNNGWNEVNPGSTVPLKFSVTKDGVAQTDRGVIGSVLISEVNCTNPDQMLGTPVDLTGRVKRTGSSFHVNWNTPLLPGRCYEVIATTSDGHSTSAFFSLKGSVSTGNLVISILATLLHLFHAPGFWGS